MSDIKEEEIKQSHYTKYNNFISNEKILAHVAKIHTFMTIYDICYKSAYDYYNEILKKELNDHKLSIYDYSYKPKVMAIIECCYRNTDEYDILVELISEKCKDKLTNAFDDYSNNEKYYNNEINTLIYKFIDYLHRYTKEKYDASNKDVYNMDLMAIIGNQHISLSDGRIVTALGELCLNIDIYMGNYLLSEIVLDEL